MYFFDSMELPSRRTFKDGDFFLILCSIWNKKPEDLLCKRASYLCEVSTKIKKISCERISRSFGLFLSKINFSCFHKTNLLMGDDIIVLFFRQDFTSLPSYWLDLDHKIVWPLPICLFFLPTNSELAKYN